MTTLSVSRRPRRDPFGEFDALVRSAFGPSFTPFAASRPAPFSPAAEILRDGDDAVVRLEIPGVDIDEDLAVALEGGRLVVRGERKDQLDAEHGQRVVREMRYGAFERSFALPSGVTAEHLSASYDAGVLTVRVAGVHAGPESTRIAVTTSAPQTIEQHQE
ncbi:Hsp20/alpha crystallin family protein [Jatrophihabitans fulvus]